MMSDSLNEQLSADEKNSTPQQITATNKSSWLPRAHPLSWAMLVITTLAILMNSIDRIILPTLLPAIMKDFNLSEVQAGWINSLSFFGTLSGAVLFGLLSDYIGSGYRRCYSWCLAVLVEIISGVATAFCKTLGVFQALRVFMGMGTGGSEPINVALLGEWWQKENRGFAIGVHHTGFPLGQFLGPVLIAAILMFGDWRHAFLFIPLIGLVIVVLQLIIGTKKNHQRVFDWIDENQLTRPIEAKPQKSSLKNSFSCLKNRNCLMAIALVFGFIWAEMGIANFLTLQLTREVGLDLSTAAIISGASGITGWIGQIAWGSFSDKRGRKTSLTFIIAGWILACTLCIFIHSATLAWAILIFWGVFRNSPYPVAYALLIDSSPHAAASSLGLMIGLAVGIAGILVAPVSGWIIHTWGFSVHYLVIVGMLLLSCIPLALLKETVNVKK